MTDRRIREDRWRGRPALAAALRLFILLAPLGGALGVSIAAARLLPEAGSGAQLALHWIGTLAVSTAALIVTDRLARRLMPLAVLLQLSLAFPKEAPSRFKVARRALNTRELQSRIETARREGLNNEPIRVASDMLALIAAVESHDRHTRGHSERVRVLTDLVADELHLSERDRDRLRWAALLHDVGKLEVPGAILNKPGTLTREEWKHIHRHPRVGARLIAPMKTWLGEWAQAVEEHHERWDGKGYPNGSSGTQISFAGRIVAVTDSYETMTGARPYRRPMSPSAAREELVRCAGEQFDPQVVRAFLQVSVKRLSLATGPLAWLAQTPILMGLGQAVGAVGRTIGSAAAAGGALAIAVAPVVAGPGASVAKPAAAAHASAMAGDDGEPSDGPAGADDSRDGESPFRKRDESAESSLTGPTTAPSPSPTESPDRDKPPDAATAPDPAPPESGGGSGGNDESSGDGIGMADQAAGNAGGPAKGAAGDAGKAAGDAGKDAAGAAQFPLGGPTIVVDPCTEVLVLVCAGSL